MSASLVGSEMCIRDSLVAGAEAPERARPGVHGCPGRPGLGLLEHGLASSQAQPHRPVRHLVVHDGA
eukprot:1980090-Alexandrium_andersonii.AAC.1